MIHDYLYEWRFVMKKRGRGAQQQQQGAKLPTIVRAASRPSLKALQKVTPSKSTDTSSSASSFFFFFFFFFPNIIFYYAM